MGLFVTLALCEDELEERAGMASKLWFGERLREAESSMDSVKSSRFFSSALDMLAALVGCIGERESGRDKLL